MIHQFDHRAASVEVNEANVHNAALSGDVSDEQKADPDFSPTPQYWVCENSIGQSASRHWTIAFRDIARATDSRTIISSAVPAVGFNNKLPLISFAEHADLVAFGTSALANLNAMVFDFLARSKVHSTSVNWFIAEQLPVVPLDTFTTHTFGSKTASEVIKPLVLELTYTAHDMASFARDMGYVDAKGEVLPPFPWDEDRRLRLRAKLDAVFFHLYGLFDADNREQSRDDISYIYSTFPIVERQEMAKHGRHLSRDLALAYSNTLAAGQPDAEPKV
jgi:hypothetical protein